MPTDPAPRCIQDGPCLCLHTPGWPSPVPVVIRVQEPLSNHCHPFIWGLLVWTQNSPYSAANICPTAEKNKDMNTMATRVCKPLQFAKHFPTGLSLGALLFPLRIYILSPLWGRKERPKEFNSFSPNLPSYWMVNSGFKTLFASYGIHGSVLQTFVQEPGLDPLHSG